MSSSYAPTGKAQRRRGRLPAQRAVELLLRLRPRHLGAARRASCLGEDGKPADFRTFLLPRARLRDRRRLGHRRAARHRQQRHRRRRRRSCPTHRSLSFNDTARCACPGPGASTPRRSTGCPYGSLFSYAITTPIIGMATGAYDAHVDLPAGARAGRLRRREGRRGPVRPGPRRRGGRASIDAAWLAARAQHARADEALPSPARRSRCALRLRVRRDQVRGTGQAIAPSTGCSRTPAGGRWPSARRSSASGATRTPAGCTRSTTPSGPGHVRHGRVRPADHRRDGVGDT